MHFEISPEVVGHTRSFQLLFYEYYEFGHGTNSHTVFIRLFIQSLRVLKYSVDGITQHKLFD